MPYRINDPLTFSQLRPLHVACKKNQPSIIRLLLSKNNIDVNATTSNGSTPLMLACTWCGEDTLQWLIEDARVDINIQDGSGFTCFMFVVQSRRPHTVRQLLQHPAINLDLTTNGNETALDLATNYNCTDAINAIQQHMK
tara:strand:- start:233 stop:652 length:420 start_codon:yes stop_codon:yes gene_type:complete